MNKKQLSGLVLLTIGCYKDVCDTDSQTLIDSINYTVNQTDINDYQVNVSFPNSVYGIYLMTANNHYESDQVDCNYGRERFFCRWNLEDNTPLGVRVYDNCYDSLEILF